MRISNLVGAVILALIVSACSNAVPYNFGTGADVRKLQQTAPSGGNAFTQALAVEYKALSVKEYDNELDYRDGELFAQKGLQAAAGNEVGPVNPERWNLTELYWPTQRTVKADLAEVYGFRTRLVEIVSCCGKERTPQVAAKAQVAYDCWVEELEEGWDTDAINMCKNNLLKHLNTMEQACGDPEPREFSIYFDFNSAEITPEGLNIVAEAASFAGATNAIALRGWADTVGDPGYNLKLSQERAEAVRAALVAAGVPAANMVTQAEGETNLPVATGANVRERRNRQVSIFIGQ